jgi:hypothetical protein
MAKLSLTFKPLSLVYFSYFFNRTYYSFDLHSDLFWLRNLYLESWTFINCVFFCGLLLFINCYCKHWKFILILVISLYIINGNTKTFALSICNFWFFFSSSIFCWLIFKFCWYADPYNVLVSISSCKLVIVVFIREFVCLYRFPRLYIFLYILLFSIKLYTKIKTISLLSIYLLIYLHTLYFWWNT